MRIRDEHYRGENWKPVRSYLQLKKLLQDAAQSKNEQLKGKPPAEDPTLAEQRRHAEELKAQIALLTSRLQEIERNMMDIAGFIA